MPGFHISAHLLRNILLTLLLLAVIASCGGNSSDDPAQPTVPKTEKPIPVIPKTSSGSVAAVPVMRTGGVVQIKVAPQPLSNPPADLSRSVSMLPSSLSMPDSPRRAVSDTDTLRARQASEFDVALPLQRVTSEFASAKFTPGYNAADPKLGHVAMSTYRLNANGFTGTPTIGVTWTTGPDDYSTYFVAVANWAKDAWDWFEGPLDGVVTLPSLTAYKHGTSGDILVLVALTGSKECTLASVSLGPPEVRGTGNSGLFGGGGSPGSGSPPIFGDSLPSSVDLSPKCAPIRDQGQIGSCTAFALGDGALNYEMRKLYGEQGWDFSGDAEKIGPRYLYIETGKVQSLPCSEEGRYYDGVVTWLKQNGICLEASAPYLPTPCDDQWGPNVAGDAAVLKPKLAEAVACTTDAGILQIKTHLAQGRTVPMGTLLDNAFMQLGPGSPPWSFEGPATGGHAMCFVGYDDAKQAFKVRNSWGPQWGDNGYAWITYNSMKNSAAGAMCYVVEMEYNQAVVDRFLGGGGDTLPTPTGLSASDGTHSDKISLSWNPVPGATGYVLFRDQQTSPLKNLGNVTSYDDPVAADGYSHTYWVRAHNGSETSGFSASDTGYAAGGGGGGGAPVIYGIYYTPGRVGEQSQFYVDYYSETPASFSWTLGGCSPGNSSEEAPVVTYATAGTHTVSISITNEGGNTMDSGEIYIAGGGGAPVADLVSNPDSGTAPLTVILDASGSTDDEGIWQFDWDWEGDGIFDYTSGGYSAIYATFPAGDWNPTVRCWDGEGLYGDASVTISVQGGSQGSYTEFEQNDSFAQSSAIHYETGDLGSIGAGAGYPGYDGDLIDVWGVSVDTPLTLQVLMDLDSSTGDLDLYIYDSFGNLGAWSETNSNQEYIEVFVNPGIYYIVVNGFAGYSDYALSYGVF